MQGIVDLAPRTGEEEPFVTLQVVLGGSDGIILASDTKGIEFPWNQALLGQANRRSLDYGKVRSAQYGVRKVWFNEAQTVALMCSGSDKISRVAEAAANTIEARWSSASTEPLRDLFEGKWRALPENEKPDANELARGTTVILVHCGIPQIFRIRFLPEGAQLGPPYVWTNSQRLVVLGGDSLNPAGFLLEMYNPEKAHPISKLAFLAAHFILVGGKLNPAGVGGLEMFFSKKGSPFQPVGEDAIAELLDRSEKLNRRVQRALLKPLNF